MKKLVTWIADDGTKFETEEDCVKYENQHKILEEKVVFIADGRIMTNKGLNWKLNECDFIVVRDIEGAKLLHQAFSDRCVCSPFYYDSVYKTGIFEYNDQYERWICVDTEITKLQDKKNKILELLEEE